MLETQKYLMSGKTLIDLKNELGISSTITNDGRVLLNYSQIESPKTNPIVRECRGLCLIDNTWELQHRSFYRFFNFGEVPDLDKSFNWDQCEIRAKEDGSLINMSYFNGCFHIHTRGSFCDGLVNGTSQNWVSLFNLAAKNTLASLPTNLTYSFELCSLYNKVVREYKEPQLYLLSVFDKETEFNTNDLSLFATEYNLTLPDRIDVDFSNIQAHLDNIGDTDPTFEGVVCRDINNNRVKIKQKKYLYLHRLHNNGCLASYKNLVPLIMAGEAEEILIHFKEMKDDIDKLSELILNIKTEIDNVWYTYKDIKDRAKFAKSIIKDTKYTHPLFLAYTRGGHPHNYVTSEYILSILKG